MPAAGRGPRLVVALDRPDVAGALALADRLDPAACRVKVGLELYTAAGPAVVESLHARGFGVFLDLKFHDIPNTVAGACRAAASLGVWMINVHAGGGPAMLEAAAAALREAGTTAHLVGVTVLTSLDARALAALGVGAPPQAQVQRLAALCQAAGLAGVVCSAQEVAALRARCGPQFLLVTPGLRGAGDAPDDQRRTATAAEALAAGADYLVVGRPITLAPDPAAALARFIRELGSAADA
jgi:orotidine-5'-phosphate decarboxylase